jgi:hypothetical protein
MMSDAPREERTVMRRQKAAPARILCLLVLFLLGSMTGPPVGARSHPLTPATAVTAFVQTTLTPRVLAVENAVALANRQVLLYCQPPEMVLVRCTDLMGHHSGSSTVAGVLTAEARVLTGASHGFDALLPPTVGWLPTLHVRCAVEDLALASDQLSALLQESADAVSRTTLQEAVDALPAPRISYGPRLRSALTILRRAEAWLETVDHETGAHATLPGFAPGAPSLETQLALQ